MPLQAKCRNPTFHYIPQSLLIYNGLKYLLCICLEQHSVIVFTSTLKQSGSLKRKRKVYFVCPYFRVLCSLVLPGVPRLFSLTFPFCLENFFDPFVSVGMLVTNSLYFSSPKYVLISPVFLRDIFTICSILAV